MDLAPIAGVLTIQSKSGPLSKCLKGRSELQESHSRAFDFVVKEILGILCLPPESDKLKTQASRMETKGIRNEHKVI